ncbi:MAG TPA: aconitate hydratase [Thermodesulfovibrionia bacterium]|nr:aconitate hydratase [Thermodesulfovibrionia bacterium]
MIYPFNKSKAEAVLVKKRKLLGRGLSYAEKILFLHEDVTTEGNVLVRGKDQIVLHPDRVSMQDATAQMAMLQFIQAGRKATQVAATIHCDHLLMAGEGADADLQKALEVNREVYDFLSSAAAKYGIGFWGPGSGIMHQVIFENYAVPGGLLIGTDSHTPNAGGIGMFSIGAGGADAAEVMAGLPWETTYPYIVGVRLTGQLTGWASAKDVILEMLNRFTVKGGTGKIIEYFGPGALTLSATQKATITNMGAELGATNSLFVYDDTMDKYLRNVGRHEDADWARSVAEILSQDSICQSNPGKVFDEIVDIDLSAIKSSHAGPYSPDRVTKVKDFSQFVEKEQFPTNVSAVLLGSCTNSSYADLYAAAEVLAQGSMHGIKPKVPFMLSPGSTQIFETIKRDGILDKILAAGATILSASCGPCIGQWDRKDVKKGVPNCLITTFNRNFRGRNDANPETKAFLTSPALAAALALSGDVRFNPETDTLTGIDGVDFKLSAPNPPALPEKGLAQAKGTFIPPLEDGSQIKIRINPNSERLELLTPFDQWDGKDFIDLPVLVKTRGKTTTDHISPGGKWLRFRGHLTNISENLLEGANNAFTGEAGRGTNVLTGETGRPLSELAKLYKSQAGGSVIVGDENYGEGSSREHAAMSPRFLGVKVVIVRSFARIHEANLKKQGILPLIFMNQEDYDKIEESDRLSFLELASIKPGKPIKGIIKKSDGVTHVIQYKHTLTEEQIKWFEAGSALNTMRE